MATEFATSSAEIAKGTARHVMTLMAVLVLWMLHPTALPARTLPVSLPADPFGVTAGDRLSATSENHPSRIRYATLEPASSGDSQSAEPASPVSSELDEVRRRNREVVGLYRQGDYGPALARALEASDFARRTIGKAHPEYATSLDNLAAAYKVMGRYDEAEPLLKEALEVRKKALGENDPDYVVSLNSLAGFYMSTGRYGEAEPMYRRALEIIGKEAGEENVFFATSLNNLASLYKAMGDYVQVEPLYKRAGEIVCRVSGEQSAEYAVVLSNLAQFYGLLGRYPEAEPIYRRSLEITRKVLGEEHPQYARTLNNLASLLETSGNFSGAEPLYRKAIEILASKSGKTTPDYASATANLAGLYKSIGDYAGAETLYREAIEIRAVSLGENHPDFAAGLGNLADLYCLKGAYGDAEPLYSRALEIDRRNLGENHPDVALDMQNLAVVYKATGKYEEAEKLYLRALEISRAALGDRHPNVALTLFNLGALCHAAGRYPEAEKYYREALELRSALLGEHHPDVAAVLNGLAAVFMATSRETEALESMKRAQSIDDFTISNVFAMASESQRLGYLGTLRGEVDAFLSAVAGPLAGSRQAVEDGLDLVIRRKAIAADALAAQRDAVLGGRYPELEPKLRELRTLRIQIARKMMAGPGPEGTDAHRRLLEKWVGEREAAESFLASRIPEMETQKRLKEVDRRAVAAALPAGASLVEYVRYNVYDFAAVTTKGQSPWKPARYLAFVLPAGEAARVTMIDIGDAAVVDRMISEFRSSILKETEKRDGRGIVAKSEEPAQGRSGVDLRAVVFDPLLKALGDSRQLFLGPDGDLNRLSFAVLPLDGERALIDDYRISYLGAGRDILRFAGGARVAPGAALVLADPDYDLDAASQGTPAGDVHPERRSRDFLRGIHHFQRLPGTRLEGERVAAMLGVTPSVGGQASRRELESVRSPRILHVATHGFFLADQKSSPGGERLQADREGTPGGPGADRFSALMEAPLLRSGIVLAGANAWLEGRPLLPEEGDGFLTAEDASALDLLSTDLVVLSACETGLGDIKAGEGVFGLRRAFLLAGAKTLLMSLWKVPDLQTQMLMVEFYGRLLRGRPRADALREAQLTVKKVFAEPFYWGAFICQGDPGVLPPSR